LTKIINRNEQQSLNYNSWKRYNCWRQSGNWPTKDEQP